MAFPTILVSSGTGSDTAASGAGPATALSGTTNASTSSDGLTVTLPASTDLSGVAVDGSHVIFLNDTTAGNRNFGKITSSAGSGGATPTVVVSNAFGGSLSSKSWAIGGLRASIGSTTSRKLFDNNGGAGDMKPGWIVQMNSAHSEALTARIDFRAVGDTTSGPVILRGASAAATRPAVSNTADLVMRSQYWIFQDFNLGAAGGSANGIISLAGSVRFMGLQVSGFSTTNITLNTSGAAGDNVLNSDIFAGGIGIDISTCQDAQIIGNYIHSGTSHGVVGNTSLTGLNISKNIITDMGGDGIHLTQGRSDAYAGVIIDSNTIAANAGDGIEYSGDSDSLGALTITDNILSSNGGYGLKFTDSETLANLQARGTVIIGNNTYSNTSGAYLPAGAGQLDPGVNPSFVGGSNFGVGPALAGLAWPTVVGLSTTTNVAVPGAAQSAASGGSGYSGGVFGG